MLLYDPTLQERFNQKYEIDPKTGCWLWTKTVTNGGYGIIGVGGLRGSMRPAHRVSWCLFHGDIPDGLHVLHRCDVPSCVNPDHLFLGTHQDNMNDKMSKGRWKGGRPRKIAKSTTTDTVEP